MVIVDFSFHQSRKRINQLFTLWQSATSAPFTVTVNDSIYFEITHTDEFD